MTTETRGTLTLVATVVGSAVAIIAVMVTLIGDVRVDLREVETGLRADIREVEASLRADIREVETSLRADLNALVGRLRAVEVGLAKVDQRLLTIERVVLPPAAPDR